MTTKTGPEDQDWLWLKKFHDGDPGGFRELFAKYKVRLINLAFRFVRHRQTAEDIAQEILIRVYEKKVHYDPRAKFSTVLYRMTANRAIDYLRKGKFESSGFVREDEESAGPDAFSRLSTSPEDSPRKHLEQAETAKLLTQAIDGLPEKLRAALVLYQFEEMPYAEIAAILGISAKAVERRLYHAREILRQKLGNILS